MFRAGLYAHVSTNDQQTLRMQNRRCGRMPSDVVGRLPLKATAGILMDLRIPS
jgi:hypothetical protein